MAIITGKERNKLKPIERKIQKKFVQKQVPNGKEICEIQLFKLIDKVHDIEVNEKEIKDYLPDIYEKLHELDRDELIKRFVSIEFNSFLSYYQDARDLNNNDAPSDRKRPGDDSLVRFYINQGKMDDLTPARLIGLINECLKKRDLEIGQIEILKSFSFFEIDKNFKEDVLSKMNEAEFNRRSVNVEVTSKPKGGGGRGRSSKGGYGKRSTTGNRNNSGGQRSDDFRPSRKKAAPGSRRRRR